MTKIELSKAIAAQTGLETKEVVGIVEAFMSIVKDSMCKGNNIYLRGFGTFHIVKRAKKPGQLINVKDGSSRGTIMIPAHHIVKFKPAKTFKKKLIKSVPVK